MLIYKNNFKQWQIENKLNDEFQITVIDEKKNKLIAAFNFKNFKEAENYLKNVKFTLDKMGKPTNRNEINRIYRTSRIYKLAQAKKNDIYNKKLIYS